MENLTSLWSDNKKFYVSFTLTALACLASLLCVLAVPVSSTVNATGPMGELKSDHRWLALPLLLVVLQLVASALLLTAAIFILQHKPAMARRLLIAGGIIGLQPVPITSALALGALFIIGKPIMKS